MQQFSSLIQLNSLELNTTTRWLIILNNPKIIIKKQLIVKIYLPYKPESNNNKKIIIESNHFYLIDQTDE